jgi:hypothetical protein
MFFIARFLLYKFDKNYFMTEITLDNQFMKCWHSLNVAEKKSLLAVAKNFVANKEHLNGVAINDEINQLINPTDKIEQSDFYTQEQITEMTRNGL